jgi:alpha-ribazole phosphatase
MTELILVRHGETDGNVRKSFCGWTDLPLNENGIKQAAYAAERLKNEDIDIIYASPLKRAYETAKLINGNHNSNIILTDALKERNFGKWEDKTLEAISECYPEECTAWQCDWANYMIESGESAVQAFQRVNAFVSNLVEEKKGFKILIVSHLGPIRYITVDMLGLTINDIWRFTIDNCGISRIRINEDGFAWLAALNS